MKIAIEALGIHDFGGGRSATLNLLQNVLSMDQKNRYTLILNQPEPALVARNLQQIILPIKNRFLARLFAQAYLPLKLHAYDLVHFSKNLGVFGLAAPSIVTIYDMTTLIHPEILPTLDVWYWKNIQPRTLKQAQRLIAISETTKRDILHFYDLDARKIQVIYPTIHPRFQPVELQECSQIRKRYGLPEEYILHVGRLDKKNNVALVVKAFEHFTKSINPNYDGKLVIVGGVYAKSADREIQPTIMRLGMLDKLIFTGRVPDEHLPGIYSAARMAIMASQHEGFGLVAVEALACGTPLIAHQVGAIPEIVGQAAFLIKEMNYQNLAEAIDAILSDRQRQHELRQYGLEKARTYQNQQDAQKTLACYSDVYEDILNEPNVNKTI